MEKTIYISDLDGTLLNRQRMVPKEAGDMINELIEKDQIHFSVATARTPGTVENILEHVKINEPIVVMNGVALYDLAHHQYVNIEYIKEEIARTIINKLGEEVISQGFIYTIADDKLVAHYDKLEGKGRINFYEERKNLKYKSFIREKVVDYSEIIYFVFIDKLDKIRAISDALEDVGQIGKVMYKDIYDDEAYLLEVYSEKATKAKGIMKLKVISKFDKVICFGDHLNDLSMFEVADEAYAVANAVDEVKAAATAVIGDNESGSVASFIKKHSRLKLEIK